MKAIPYSSWSDTAVVLHLASQMLGKFKLHHMPAQPEWQQVTLPLTARGFSTGLVPCNNVSCTISVDVFESKVMFQATDGRERSFPLQDGRSVAEYYDDFLQLLADLDINVEINPKPQEMAVTTPFDEDTEPRTYDAEKAQQGLAMMIFAHNAILDFVSGMRCKKKVPELFWGTFDVTGVLFSGVPAPFPGEGVIEEVAFDEELIEYGFWPGDFETDEPSFFVLPYPFIEGDLSGTLREGSKGWYSKDKAEYFLTLKDVLESDDPHKEIQEFFTDAFHVLSREGVWERKEWFMEPLLV